MPIPFEFVIAGPPVSQQARNPDLREQWKERLQDAARQGWDAAPPVAEPVSVAITYFFDHAQLDVDNIPKPILDALQGIVYVDDAQVFDLLCRKRDLNDVLDIPDPPPELTGYLGGKEQVLHISFAESPSPEVTF